jgi:glycerol uptake facilitator-like aquaporin
MTTSGTVQSQQALGGVHLPEWAAEFTGTALLLFDAVTAIYLTRDMRFVGLRVLIIGLAVGGSVCVAALSPPGRRSGGHLSPAITLGFWLRGGVHWHDLVGYSAAQLAGSVAGATVAGLVWGPGVRAVQHGLIAPAPGWGVPSVFLVEAASTTVLVLAIFVMVSHVLTVTYTPWVAGAVVTALIWVTGSRTGGGFNPARAFGSAIAGGHYHLLWLYLLAPLVGAALAASLVRWTGLSMVTCKLFHDGNYCSTMRSELPVKARTKVWKGL